MNKLQDFIRNPRVAMLGLALAIAVGIGLSPELASAYGVPVAGDLFFEAFDFLENSVLNGPLAYMAALLGVATGIFMFFRGQWQSALITLSAAAVIGGIPAVVGSMGMVL